LVDKENTTKAEEQAADENENIEGALSLEELDSVIAADDPDFAKSLHNIGPDDPNNAIYEEGVELQYKLEDEIKIWQEAKGWRAKIAKVLPFVPRLSYKLKMKRTVMRLGWQKFKGTFRENIKNSPKLLLSWIKGRVGALKESLADGLVAFKTYPLPKKLMFVGLVAATGASIFIIYRMSTRGILPPDEDLFMGSMTEWAAGKYIYDPTAQQEAFYESTRTSQNILLLKKMVANLKRSSSSGDNPMAAFEFYVEGTVSEVVVEIKDREPEIRDLFLRTMEDTTFDQAASGEGKKLLCDRLRKEVNKILTTGFVRRIFIKTAIVKP
jgi:flagellar basal body-associated protein FliL